MEKPSLPAPNLSLISFSVAAAAATALCFLGALWAVRSDAGERIRRSKKKKKKKGGECTCSCGGGDAVPSVNGDMGAECEREAPKAAAAMAAVERQTGASMMEQLVPEITTHALSYLDYSSLCRLSMTNSSMRKAANDDGAWKALYHKDFSVEQDSVRPLNGWKSYYAATKAVVNINAEFYNIIKERSLQEMRHFWLRADYVKCVHASGELFTGYNAVIGSWALSFNWEPVTFQLRDVCARVLTDVAWVTMKVHVNIESGPFNVTNLYELHNGRWYMVHHHCSQMPNGGDAQHHNIFG